MVERFERRERRIVAEDDDGSGNRSLEYVARDEPGKRTVKELEPDGDLPQFLRIGVADHEQMVGAHASPRVARLGGGRCRHAEQDNEKNSECNFHKAKTA